MVVAIAGDGAGRQKMEMWWWRRRKDNGNVVAAMDERQWKCGGGGGGKTMELWGWWKFGGFAR